MECVRPCLIVDYIMINICERVLTRNKIVFIIIYKTRETFP